MFALVPASVLQHMLTWFQVPEAALAFTFQPRLHNHALLLVYLLSKQELLHRDTQDCI